MQVFNVSIMLSVQLTYILLFLSLCGSVFSFPSTPLNERSQEISWQAWLLVDDQNQQHQNRQSGDDVIPRRRITPKSVFVAPTFFPESLPACADGYSSDDMGRCIKIIKLDEDRHLEFLVSKLNDKFGIVDYEEEVEEMDTTKSEPFQLNIPLSLDDTDYSSDTPQEDVDFAIIVTPTTKVSDQSQDGESKVDKRNDQTNEDMYEEELKKLLQMATTKNYDVTTLTEDFKKTTVVNHAGTTEWDEIGTTTVHAEEEKESTTHVMEERETTTVMTTTSDAVEETTAIEEVITKLGYVTESSKEVDSSTFIEVTTILEGTSDEPTTFEASKLTKSTSTTPKITTATPKITTYHPKVITYHPYLDISVLGNSKTKNLITFPDDEENPVMSRNHPDGNFVRFPDADSKFQQESQLHHTRDVNDQSNYFNEIVTPESSHRVQETVLPPKGSFKGQLSGFAPSEARHLGPEYPERFHPTFFPSKEVSENAKGFHVPLDNQRNYQYYIGATTEKLPAKKIKEKHGSMFLLPQKWSQNNHQKPLVLRSLPMDDLSFLFGYKHGQKNHR